MAMYEINPNRYGLNFMGGDLGKSAEGILTGILQRQDPRNIEIRRTWADPSKHMTPFGFAPGTPNTVIKDFDVIGGFIQSKDANGNTTYQWDQRYQKKGTPLPPGYQILSDPYQQFPGTAKIDKKPELNVAEVPSVLSPLKMEGGGKVPGNNPLQALITLLEIEHNKPKKGEVPAILHEGEGVVTKKGMKVLDGVVGGIDSLNALGESLPKMEKGGEVGKSDKKKEESWELMTDESGKKVWVQTKGEEGQTYPWEPYLPKQHTSGETYFLPWDPVNRQPEQYTQNPAYSFQPFMGGGMINPYGGVGPSSLQTTPAVNSSIMETTPSPAPAVETPLPIKPGVNNNNTPMNAVVLNSPPMTPSNQTPPAYRDWNAPSQFSFGQLQGMNPLQALGMIQADVESRGVPPLQPVYGAQGQVLPQQTIADQRIARQGALANQYLGGLQGEATKTQTDWYPKEAKARIDQINSQIAYNNAMLKGGSSGGFSPEDMLKLAQIDKINAELSANKISALESALKLSDKMDKKSKQLLMLEYLMVKYPVLTERPADELLKYIGKAGVFGQDGINILGITFGKPEVSPEDVALVANRVSGTTPIVANQTGSDMSKVLSEYQNQPTTMPAQPNTPPMTTRLLNAQNALMKSGVIK